ncbi:MAG: DUF3341 domain-containing protein [Gammaproteobacteria bacterium]|nr:DUF3341 domain-containing protein [Gammaproteobacteria bacterium]
MSCLLIARFASAEALRAAAHQTRAAGFPALDAFAPFAVDGLAEALGVRRSRVRVAMLVGGLTVAAFAYGIEWYSAVVDYPIVSGGRALHAWPAFLLFPITVGILAAAICGVIAFLVETGMPALHHRCFALPGFDRVSQDGFLLALECPDEPLGVVAVRDCLQRTGAIALWTVQT